MRNPFLHKIADIVIICAISLIFAGCSASGSLFTPSDVNVMACNLQAAQKSTMETVNSMVTAGTFDSNRAAQFEKINTQLLAAEKAIQNYVPTGNNVQDFIGQAQAVNATTIPYNPWSGYITLGLGALSAILTAFGVKQTVTASNNAEALDQVVTGNQLAMQNNSVVEEAIKKAQEQTQNTKTQNLVDAIKNS